MPEKNLLGTALEPCSLAPLTGFARDGYCRSHPADGAAHLVCATLTDTFLSFTRSRGNDLSGLRAGDRWCLCAGRWREALEGGAAPPVVPSATAEQALQFVNVASSSASSHGRAVQ